MKATKENTNMILPLLAEVAGSIHVGLAALGSAIGVGLIGMGAACAGLQHKLLRAHFDGKAAAFLALSEAVDRLSQVTFVPPMEGYIRRMLWVLAHLGVIERESAHDPWGPELEEGEFVAIGKTLRALGELPPTRVRGVAKA